MDDDTSFSLHHNAKRAAERAIDAGTAPSINYGIRTREDGRFAIVWKTGCESPAATEEEIATGTAEAEAETPAHTIATGDETLGEVKPPAEPITNPSDGEGDMPDIFPPGTRVIVQVAARKRRTGAVDYRVDATSCRVKLDGPHPSQFFLYNQLSLDDGSEPLRPVEKPPRKPRAAPSGDRKPSKAAELDAQAATGAMPTKPIMTSKANPHYQKRFDQLEKWALADDWNAIRGYEVKGINSYAKMVRQYRDRLIAAHAAQSAEAAP